MALARLLTSSQPLHLDAARYAFYETAAHLLNNRTKSVESYNDRFGFKVKTRTIMVGVKIGNTDCGYVVPAGQYERVWRKSRQQSECIGRIHEDKICVVMFEIT
ncbi:hypothetical protein [Prevotella sp. OH937_COT-195]|uniref:hypothetical protein n=1 Tax=Prevotella sp. OH937_COT-195 TaxID=2491051 RepID=UPI000F64AF42|nr:hypothetical protein [Prevotella sp. OH937_COT-195]RRC99443.1 hypothetical protein EII32_07940 [Prevotella sp. OH937_COT-195]